MSANTPPKPHTEGMVFTNDETGIKYQFSGGAWRAVSSSASEEVAEAIDNLDLQKVLDKGNVADKGAEFGGKVKVDPGTEGNEAVTYGQLSIVEEELEQLAPSIERGSWTFTLNHPPGVGQYTMIKNFLDEDAQIALCDTTYRQCIIDADGDAQKLSDCNREYNACVNGVGGSIAATTEDWTLCSEIVFNDIDANGVTHTWAGIDSDHYIDVFNSADDSFMVGDITMHGGGTFEFDLVSSRGNAVGLASIKVFKAQGSVDFDQYVRKTGDTMTGILETTSNIWIRPNDQGAKGSGNMLVVNQSSEAGGSIARFQKDNKDIMKIASDNIDCNNHRIISVGKPTGEKDAVNMEYLKEDEYVHAPAHLSWAYSSTDSRDTPRDTNFSRDDLNIWRFSLQTRDGVDLSQTLIDDTNVHSSEFLMSIWFKPSAGGWALKRIVRCKKFRWGIKDSKGHHFEIHQSDNFGTGLANGGRYYVTIAGLF